MTNPDPKSDWLSEHGGTLTAPGFVTFTNVTPSGAKEEEFVITNEATGKYFLANQSTVQFFAAIQETGTVRQGLLKAGILPQHGENLVKRLIEAGLLVRQGETQSKAEIKSAPLESKLISIRWDLLDTSRVVRSLNWLGRLLFSPFGYFAWVLSLVAMAMALMANAEKVRLGLRQLLDADWYQLALFCTLYVVLKIIHEMGHALAYRIMCLQENIDPGPIRMGISIFAFTPFPFTDVSGAWRLRSVFRRVMIGGGGIYFETWAICAFTLFWAQTQAGTFQTTILQVVVVAGFFALLFNLNPAIKLDGYYMLTDYLRRPNLAGRASIAARTTLANALGAPKTRVVGSDLAYWVLSYAYRWTIFGGIFWLLYRFDPRLAPIAAIVVGMTLVGRPLFNSLKFARKAGAKPLRSLVVVSILAGAIAVCFVPFPDRILLPGQMRSFETTFVEPPENGRLLTSDTGYPVLENPNLDQQIKDLEFRQAMLENLRRGGASSGVETAQLQSELASFQNSKQELLNRRAALELVKDSPQIWTVLDLETYSDSWVTPSAQLILGAQSQAVPAHLRLRLDQGSLEQGISLVSSTLLDVRPVHDPTCSFKASLSDREFSELAHDGTFTILATPVPATDPCVLDLKHGGAVIARLKTQPRSIIERIKIGGSRLLQNRLPIELD
jgi:hypothetical protein